ncbi:hypothetical protein LUZ60_011372 [Juncus effusus]|nr:hypothetical protein LUZ60_011372 [Juncus effusus]
MTIPLGPSISAPPPPPEPTTLGTVRVVDPQFCVPYVVNLTVTKKKLSLSDGDFSVKDVNGNLLMKVQGRIFSLRERRVLCDPAGIPIISMQQKMNQNHTLTNIVFGKDEFGLTVYPNVDFAFVVAIIVILDEIHRDSRE